MQCEWALQRVWVGGPGSHACNGPGSDGPPGPCAAAVVDPTPGRGRAAGVT